MRNDGVRRLLQPPYDGPYKVLERRNSNFLIELNGRPVTVAAAKIKFAFIEVVPKEERYAATPQSEPSAP